MADKIKIYTTEYCPYCHSAMAFLKSKKLTFEQIDVTDDDAMREKLVKLTGRETVPQIFISDKSIGGYEDLLRHYGR